MRLEPVSRQICATVSLPICRWLARVRVVQWVPPSGGATWRVTRNTSATVPGGSHGLRPRPLAIRPTPATPWLANRCRQLLTVSEAT